MSEFINKYKRNFFIVFFIGFAIYFYIILKNDAREVTEKITSINMYYIVIVLGLLLIYVFLEGLVIYLFTKRIVKGISLFDSFRLNLSTQFFNAITPFSSGGQPFQVLYLGSRGIKVKDSTSIVMMNYITYNIAFVLIGITCLVLRFDYFNNILAVKGYKYILLIGFGVNVSVTILTFFLAFSKKIYHLIIEIIWVKIIKWPIIRKFKLENKTEKIKEAINDFHEEIKNLHQNKTLWLLSVMYHSIRVIIFHMIPIYIFQALGENIKGMEVNLIIGAFFVSMVMSYIPTPGASGGAEGMFYIIFGYFFKNNVIPALILWRFITYYLYILLGIFALVTMNYKNNLRELNYPKDS